MEKTIELLATASRSYPLYILPAGGAEQNGDDWWRGMCESTRELFTKTDVRPEQIACLSFCSQMQGLILADRDGIPVRRPMSYMDQRAKAKIKKGIANGLQVAGVKIFKLIPSLIINGEYTIDHIGKQCPCT